jgi:hypothetical protein
MVRIHSPLDTEAVADTPLLAQVFIWAYFYHITVIEYGHPSAIASVPWTFNAAFVLHTTISAIVQVWPPRSRDAHPGLTAHPGFLHLPRLEAFGPPMACCARVGRGDRARRVLDVGRRAPRAGRRPRIRVAPLAGRSCPHPVHVCAYRRLPAAAQALIPPVQVDIYNTTALAFFLSRAKDGVFSG